MYKIGGLATKLSVSKDTLRYYEQHQLLKPAARTDAGYRLYSEQNLQEMLFILQAKKVGFTLNEISALLAIRVDKAHYSCNDVKSYTAQKLNQVEQEILALEVKKQQLSQLVDACCGGDEKADNCTILSSLENNDDAS